MRGCLHSAFLAGEGRRSDRFSRKLARHGLFLVIALAIGRTRGTRIHFQSHRVRGSLGCVMKYIVFSGQRSHGFSPLAPFIEPRQ